MARGIAIEGINNTSLLKEIESAIKTQKYGDQPRSLYEPLRYIMRLGGKRLRPMLTLLAYSLYKNNATTIIPLAIAVETFHNFTLLHDDIMDQAPLRRGKSTVHRKWNVNTAILSGDVMQIKVYEMLLGAEESNLKEVLVAFNECATRVCEGQQWDMEFETKSRVTEAEYLQMIRLKTAALLGFCLKLGAILGDANSEDKMALYEFGELMGIGFQLKDDLLDVYADKTKFGKQVGGDIISNKRTFLLIQALRKAKGHDRYELHRWLALKKFNKQKKVQAITAIYDSLDIKTITGKKIDQYFSLAFQALDRVSATPDKKNKLKEFALGLIERQA
jgi:geranylgeranyl diphosphate synthase, type II